MNISMEAVNISKYLHNLISQSKHSIGTWELCLLGSQARGEASKKNNGISQSDIELFLVSEKPNSSLLKEIKESVKNNKLPIDVDIDGTTFQKFKNYAPKLWTCDSARFPRVVTQDGIKIGGPFIRFSKSFPAVEEFEFLILNRSIEWLKKGKDDSWSAIKFFGDASFFILYTMGIYSTSYSERYKNLRDLNAPFPGIPSRLQKRVKKILLNALYCRLEDELFAPDQEDVDSIFELAQEILKDLLKHKVVDNKLIIYRLFPTKWIIDWMRAHKLNSERIFGQLKKDYSPPKYRIYRDIYSSFLNFSQGTSYECLYTDWEHYCKQ